MLLFKGFYPSHALSPAERGRLKSFVRCNWECSSLLFLEFHARAAHYRHKSSHPVFLIPLHYSHPPRSWASEAVAKGGGHAPSQSTSFYSVDNTMLAFPLCTLCSRQFLLLDTKHDTGIIWGRFIGLIVSFTLAGKNTTAGTSGTYGSPCIRETSKGGGHEFGMLGGGLGDSFVCSRRVPAVL